MTLETEPVRIAERTPQRTPERAAEHTADMQGETGKLSGLASGVAEILSTSASERVCELPELGAHTLLAIDTALGTSVAVGHNGRVFEVSSDDSRGHAEVIGGLLSRVFSFAKVSPEAVTGVIAGIGPGPFTGLRVGIAAAHAFAVGRGVPLLPLQSHEAVALAALESGAARTLRVVQDARRRELFVTSYEGYDRFSVPSRIVDPHLETRDSFAPEPDDVWPERIPAGRLVQLAARRLVAGAIFEEDRALYLRAPDVKPAGAVKRVSVPGERAGNVATAAAQNAQRGVEA